MAKVAQMPGSWGGVPWGAVVTMVTGQVGEGQRLTAHAVSEPLQEDIHGHRLGDLQVLVGWGFEHDGDLAVHVGLREVGAAFPGGCAEHHRDVLWQGHGGGS